MNSFKLWPTLLALIIGGTIGFFIGKNSTSHTSTESKNEKKVIAQNDTKKEEKKDTSITETNTGEISSNNDSPAEKSGDENNPRNTSVPEKLPTLPVKNLCYIGDDQLSEDLTLFAERKEKEKLMYDKNNPENLRDCSGIFHRVVRHVRNTCDGYKYPEPKDARSSRSLARWFHDNNNFSVINDAVSQRNLIRPGAVMFFGQSEKKYNDLNIDKLSGGIISHIGVVTEVTKDEAGNVTGYVMFHGRREGVHAQRSHYHQITPPKKGFPPLGNWEQQWVGIAYIMTPA